MLQSACSNEKTGQPSRDLKPVFLFKTSSQTPGQVETRVIKPSPGAAFLFSKSNRINLYPVQNFFMGVIKP